jgi:DNA-binding response OmpR family regulator
MPDQPADALDALPSAAAHEQRGLGVCQAIKARAGTTVVVRVTGHASATNRVRAMLAGCDVDLAKPIVDASFVAVLAKVDPLFS